MASSVFSFTISSTAFTSLSDKLFIMLCSSLENEDKTQFARSQSGEGLLPTPIFILGNLSYPHKFIILFIPLCPPCEPFLLILILPMSRVISSNITTTFSIQTL